MNPLTTFEPFAKMPRLNREVVITEKIDGTNAQICIIPRAEFGEGQDGFHALAIINDLVIGAGSRTRWIRPKVPGEKGDPDNYGFARWVQENAAELIKLGPGRHFGEWWGRGINSGYGLDHRRFSLFNTDRWLYTGPNSIGVVDRETGTYINCVYAVPVIWSGSFDRFDIDTTLDMLRVQGSFAAPGFKQPEGIVIFHTAAQHGFKVTLENDASPKSLPGVTNSRTLASGVGAAQHAFEQKIKPFVPLASPALPVCKAGCIGEDTPLS